MRIPRKPLPLFFLVSVFLFWLFGGLINPSQETFAHAPFVSVGAENEDGDKFFDEFNAPNSNEKVVFTAGSVHSGVVNFLKIWVDSGSGLVAEATCKADSCETAPLGPYAAGTTIWYRAEAQYDVSHYATTNFKIFTTGGSAPTITNQTATVRGTNVSLNARIETHGINTTAWFRYSNPNANPGSCNDSFGTKIPAGTPSDPEVSSNTDFSLNRIVSLSAGEYFYCTIAKNSVGTTLGTLESFTIAGNSGSIEINGGDSSTTSPNVTLTLTCSGECDVMRIANTLANLSTAASEGFATTKNWTLSAGAGTKAVYVQFAKLGNPWWPMGGYEDTIDLVAAGSFEITPVPPSRLDCGETPVGTSTTCSFRATNNTGSDVDISDVVSSDPIFTPIDTSVNVPAGEFRDIEIRFNATAVGTHDQTITFTVTSGDIERLIRGKANPSVGPGPVCGNSAIDGGETCDDGNTTPGDGCSGSCQIEAGWTCTGTPSVCTSGGGGGPVFITFPNPLGATSFTDLINNIINFLFTIAVIVAPVLLVIAGVVFMTAAGDPTRVATARRMLLWTIVGFGIILISKGLVEVLKGILGI